MLKYKETSTRLVLYLTVFFFHKFSLKLNEMQSKFLHFLSTGAFSIMYFPQNMTVNESASVSFFCNATSYAPYDKFVPQISWSKLRDNSKVLPPGQQLVIRNVSRYDGGTYICTAKNGLGLPDTKAAVLNVLRE